MRRATLRRAAVALGVVGIAAVAAGAFLVADLLHEARRDVVAEEARRGFEEHVRTAVLALERLADEAGRTVATEILEEGAAPSASPREEAEQLFRRLQPAFAALRAPEGAAVAVYDLYPTPTVRGVATASTIDLDAATTWEGRLSPGAIESMVRVDAIDGWVRPEAGHVWFSEASGGGVRLHRTLVFREFGLDDEAKPPEMIEAAHLVDASMPLRSPVGATASVRCDVGGGGLLADLPLRAADGDRPPASGDVVTAALDPARVPWTFASPGAAARAEVRAPRPPWFDAYSVLAVACVAILLLALTLGVIGRRRAPPPPPDVTAEAAHEMRTPLTAMRGSLEVALRREREPKEYREALEACLEEVKGLQSLIDAVLFLGRGGQVAPAREPVDLRALAAGEVGRLRASQPEREITLDGEAPVVVPGDPSLLARALGNLLDNAALHSVPGGAIRVAVAVTAAEAVVTVEDAGPGIPEARRERIFERFFRGPEAGRRGIPGAGLGLPIARWIAEIHGGSLTLDPKASDRARFLLVLPRSGTPRHLAT